jgi:hemolysin activation/secretion protein
MNISFWKTGSHVRSLFSILTICIVAALLLNSSSKANAQSAAERAAQQADQINRDRAADEQRRRIENNRLKNKAPKRAPAQAPKLDAAKADEPCVQVNSISTKGIELLNEAIVNGVLQSFRKRCLSLSELNNILKQLTFLYVEKGYITSRAYLPEQDLSDGSLEVVVIEGKLAGVVMNDRPGEYKGQIITAFPNMKNNPVNLRDIEQGLDQLNRLRSNNANIELKAGKKPGSTILSVKNEHSKRWYGSVTSDNLGSTATGEMQSRADFAIDDVLGLNDLWSFSYQRSMDNHPFHFSDAPPRSDTYTVGFSLPYGYWTFGVDGSWSEYNSQIAGQVSDIDTSGLSKSVTVNLSRVLHRDQISKTSLTGSLQWKENQNFLLGSRIDISSRMLSIGGLELTHSRQLLSGQFTASAGYLRGLDVLGAFDDATAPIGSPKGQFRKAVFSLGYFKPFKIGPLTASYSGSVSGQWSPDLLFGSEQMALGGFSTIRGLRESVVFGNRAIMTRNEIALQLPASTNSTVANLFGSLEPYAALDFGQVFSESQYQIEGGSLTGATIGLRSRGGNINFDFSYSDIVTSSGDLTSDISKSGLFAARVTVSF